MRTRARRVFLPVGGMHCASCAAKLEGELSLVPGVGEVVVDLVTRTVAVTPVSSALDIEHLRRAVRAAGYEVLERAASPDDGDFSRQSQDEEERKLLRRFLGGVLLALPIHGAPGLSLSPYTSLLLALSLQIWGGWHFHEGLLRSLRRRSADMNTLVSLSTWAAFLFSAAVVLAPGFFPPAARQPQWDAVTGLVTMVTLGRWLESKTRRRTSQAVLDLMLKSPRSARVVRAGVEESVPLDEVERGETIRVKPGEQVGLDGVVRLGSSTVDESLLTGESLAVEKAEGSRVWGGTVNKTGWLEVEVSARGHESALARIIESVRESQATKPRIQLFADKAAAAFVPFVVLTAAVSAALWAIYGPEPKVVYALTALVSVFAVACPCALGLATPLAVMAGIGRAAGLGVFIRNAEVIEEAGLVDVVIFDKTGTLTLGKPRVVETLLLRGTEREFWSYARAAEERSEHPAAQAVVARARELSHPAAPVESFEAFPGRGVSIRSGGRAVLVGSPSWLKQEGCPLPSSDAARLSSEARTWLGVALDGELLGLVALADALRPGAREAVAELKSMGLEVILLSGDRNAAAYRVAEETGISRVYAESLPEDKARIVEKLKSEGKRVAMVGEGFNDAPALSRADVGIALASGTDVAVSAADITLLNPDLSSVARALLLCRRIRRVIRENLYWAFAYNMLLIPAAAGALYPFFGLTLKPQYAGAAMALSSISVALNSLRLRRG